MCRWGKVTISDSLALFTLVINLSSGLVVRVHPFVTDAVSVHTPGIDPARTEKVREPSRLPELLCWRGFAPINWCWGPAWERVRHGSWRGRLRGGTRKPSGLAGCKWRSIVQIRSSQRRPVSLREPWVMWRSMTTKRIACSARVVGRLDAGCRDEPDVACAVFLKRRARFAASDVPGTSLTARSTQRLAQQFPAWL